MSKNTDLSSLINYVKGASSGRLTLPFYTSTTSFTGTVAGYLAFDSSGNILTTTSPATQWTTSGSNIYFNTGNVGINNSTPAYRLDVVGDINITGSFRINGTPIGTGGGGGISGSGTTNYLTKWSGSTSVTNSIAYDSGSDFAIGTSNPLYRFTVQPFTNLNFGIGRTSLFASDDTIFMNAVNNTYGAIPMAINASHLGFYVGFSEAMRINSSKVVMIGTTSGISGGGLLQVNGDVNISGTFKVNGTAIGTGGGTGNISGSGSYGYLSLFTAGQTIGNSPIYGSPLGSSNSFAAVIVNSSGTNPCEIGFYGDSEIGYSAIYASSSFGTPSLKIYANRIKTSGKLNIGNVSTTDMIVGDLYVDANGFVKRATSAT